MQKKIHKVGREGEGIREGRGRRGGGKSGIQTALRGEKLRWFRCVTLGEKSEGRKGVDGVTGGR